MPEGPSLVILAEQMQPYVGKTVTMAGGYAEMEKSWLKGKKLLEVRSWGKHLLLRFANGTIRIHLMLFGSVLFNKTKKVNASLYLKFGEDRVSFYVVQAKKLDGKLDKIYDWRTDIMSPLWDIAFVKRTIKAYPDSFIGDLLLDQQVFTGVGNIIRVEVLFRAKIHPLSIVQKIPAKAITALLKHIRSYGKEFLAEKRAKIFGKNWEAYGQKECPRDGQPLKIQMVGRTKRKTYFCTHCQELYK
jgi:endonuclease VIII